MVAWAPHTRSQNVPEKNLKTIPQRIRGTPGSSVPASAASDGLRARGKGDSREAAKSGRARGARTQLGNTAV